MQWVRNRSIGAANAVVTPSGHLAETVSGWTGRDDVAVVPNGARTPPEAATEGRSTPPGLDLVFVGRLVPVKQAEVLIEAVVRVPAARLTIVGDGPELQRLQALAGELAVTERVTFMGALGHDEVMLQLARADALVLASSHEGLPHVLIEALASGTPVVASRAGGMAEVLTDGVDGRLVDDVTPGGFAREFQQLVDDPALLARLTAGAATTGMDWRFERCADRLLGIMSRLTEPWPGAVFVGKSRPRCRRRPTTDASTPSTSSTSTPSSCAPRAAPPSSGRRARPSWRYPPSGSRCSEAWYSTPSGRCSVWRWRPGVRTCAISCQSPYEAFGTLVFRQLLPPRLRPPVQVELHGDWRTASRLYGSRKRRMMSFATDRIAEWAIRRADRVRPVSKVLADRARAAGYTGPIDRYVPFSDYSSFLEAPLAPLRSRPRRSSWGCRGLQGGRRAARRMAVRAPRAARRPPDHRRRRESPRRARSRIGPKGSTRASRCSHPSIAPRSSRSWTIRPAWCCPRSEGLARIVLEAMARAPGGGRLAGGRHRRGRRRQGQRTGGHGRGRRRAHGGPDRRARRS